MTLDVKNFHSTVHIRQVNMSMIEYARSVPATQYDKPFFEIFPFFTIVANVSS